MTDKADKSKLDKADKYYSNKNYDKAFPHYEELARKGFALAQHRLGVIYDEDLLSEGVADIEEGKEAKEAVYWFRRAAEQDNVDSQFNLAGYYCTGEGGVEISYANAYYWYRRASRFDDVEAKAKLLDIKNLVSTDNFKTCKYVVNGYSYSTVWDSFEALVNGWNSERIRDLIIYLSKIYHPDSEITSTNRAKLTTKNLKTVVNLVTSEKCYDLLADVIEFEHYEQECVDYIYELVESFTLDSIRSKRRFEPAYGDDISIVRELKVAFDGYSEDEEDIDRNSRSYVTYIHKSALELDFIFPPHEATPLGAMIRPGSELHVYSWYDKSTDSIEVINVEEHLKRDKMSAVHIYNILSKLSERYNEKRGRDYLSIFIGYEADDYGPTFGKEVDADKQPGEEEAHFNAERMCTLANKFCNAVEALINNKLKKAYVGLLKEGNQPAEKRIILLREMNLSRSNKKYIEKFYESTKEELKIWPHHIWYVVLTIDLGDSEKVFSDSDFLSLTHSSDTDIDAVVFNKYTNEYVVQGYYRGEYDTGFFSNDGDDSYSSQRNRFIVNLQNQEFVDALYEELNKGSLKI